MDCTHTYTHICLRRHIYMELYLYSMYIHTYMPTYTQIHMYVCISPRSLVLRKQCI